MSAAEVAQGTRYTEALTTSWRPPKHYRDMTEEDCDKLREKWSILVDVSFFYVFLFLFLFFLFFCSFEFLGMSFFKSQSEHCKSQSEHATLSQIIATPNQIIASLTRVGLSDGIIFCARFVETPYTRIQGEKVPPPIKSFREMKLPDPMLAALEAKGIKRPTPIQVRKIPVVSGNVDV